MRGPPLWLSGLMPESDRPDTVTDAMQNQPEAKADTTKFLVDFGPILVFVLLYQYLRRTSETPDTAIYTAGLVFAVVAALALLWSRLKLGKFSGILTFTTIMVLVTVGLAWVFRDPRFLYVKPTVVNAAYGVILIGGAMIAKNPLKMLMGSTYTMSDAAWRTLAIRAGLFFFFAAAVNEFVWRTQTENFWVNFKLLGMVPLTFAFMLSQSPFLVKHAAEFQELRSRGK